MYAKNECIKNLVRKNMMETATENTVKKYWEKSIEMPVKNTLYEISAKIIVQKAKFTVSKSLSIIYRMKMLLKTPLKEATIKDFNESLLKMKHMKVSPKMTVEKTLNMKLIKMLLVVSVFWQIVSENFPAANSTQSLRR